MLVLSASTDGTMKCTKLRPFEEEEAAAMETDQYQLVCRYWNISSLAFY